MPRMHQTKTAKQEGPKDPLRSDVTAHILGVTRAGVYQYWQAGRLRAWRAKGTAIGQHGDRPSFFFEREEVEALGAKLTELRRLQTELGYRKPGRRCHHEMPTEWEECIPPGASETPEEGA